MSTTPTSTQQTSQPPASSPSPQTSQTYLAPPRPSQGKFNRVEKEFLKTFRDAYTQHCVALSERAKGPNKTGGIKGEKSDWVNAQVYPKFVARFKSDGPGGPNLESLKEKMVQWFQNNAHPSKRAIEPIPRCSPKKPRAVNGIDMFEKKYKLDVTKKAADVRKAQNIESQGSVNIYMQVLRDMYQEADPDMKAACEGDAKAFNDLCREKPPASEIYASQGDLKYETAASLRNLTGWEWGGYGDVVFFVMGAYCNENSDVETFNITLSNNPNTPSFAGSLINFNERLHRPFTKFASAQLRHCVANTIQPFLDSSDKNDIASSVVPQAGSPRHPDTSTERVAVVNDAESVTGVSAPPILYTPQPDEAAKVPITSTVPPNPVPPLVSPAYDSVTPAVSTEFVTTAEDAKAPMITSSSDTVIIIPDEATEAPMTTTTSDPAITKPAEVAEAPLTSTKSDATLKQGPRRRGRQGTTGTGKARKSKDRGTKRKVESQSEESTEVPSKKCKTDNLISTARTSARIHSNNYTNSYVSVR